MYTISIQIVKGKKLFECRLSIISMLQKFRMSFSKKLFGQDQAHVCLFSPTIYFCLVLLNLNFSKTTHEKNPMIWSFFYLWKMVQKRSENVKKNFEQWPRWVKTRDALEFWVNHKNLIKIVIMKLRKEKGSIMRVSPLHLFTL